MDITELGAKLRQQRENLGFSLEEVADSTKVSKRILVAFEEGDRDHFPHRVYAKGFVQSYAKVLGLDPREFGEAMEEALRPCDGASTVPGRPVVCEPPAPRNWRVWFLVIFLAALLGVLVWYFFLAPVHPVTPAGFAPESSLPAGEARDGTAPEGAPAGVPTAAAPDANASDTAPEPPAADVPPQATAAAPAEQASVQASAGDVAHAVSTAPAAATASDAASTPAVAPTPTSAVVPAPAPAAPLVPTMAAGHHLLRVTALDEKGSWVGVWIPGQEDLAQSLNVNGHRTVDIDVSELRRFKFGRVEGITATFDGKPLDLGKAGTRTIHLPTEP